MRRVKKGVFLTLEGGEGSGKTTQIRNLSDWLQGLGYRVIVTREPGGTPFADRLRQLLLHSKPGSVTPEMELFLYETARRDHVETVIRPGLGQKAIVLCDRFTDATLAYQGFGRGLSVKTIEDLNQAATGGLKPDRTFVLDLPATEGLKRARKRNKKLDRLEKESLAFHRRVRRGYLTLARKEPKRIRIIHADRDPNHVFAQLRREVEKLL